MFSSGIILLIALVLAVISVALDLFAVEKRNIDPWLKWTIWVTAVVALALVISLIAYDVSYTHNNAYQIPPTPPRSNDQDEAPRSNDQDEAPRSQL